MPHPQHSRLEQCWRISSCHTCINSPSRCGWCPQSSTCIPASSLLEPISNAKICPLKAERFELRTKALGCGCSTTTLLSVIVTVFATIVALVLIYGVGVVVLRCNAAFGTGTWRGIEVEIKDDGSRMERQWTRRGTWVSRMGSFFRRRGSSSDKSEQELTTERSRLLR